MNRFAHGQYIVYVYVRTSHAPCIESPFMSLRRTICLLSFPSGEHQPHGHRHSHGQGMSMGLLHTVHTAHESCARHNRHIFGGEHGGQETTRRRGTLGTEEKETKRNDRLSDSWSLATYTDTTTSRSPALLSLRQQMCSNNVCVILCIPGWRSATKRSAHMLLYAQAGSSR